MLTRAAGSRPSSRIQGMMAALDPSNTALLNESCSSRSDGMGCLRDTIGLRGFRYEYIQGWNISIPLDQCRDMSKTSHCGLIECPDGLADLRSVCVNPNLTRAHDIDSVARKMDLLDRAPGNGVEIGEGIEAMIPGADIDVVDIEQHAAPRFPRQGRDKIP